MRYVRAGAVLLLAVACGDSAGPTSPELPPSASSGATSSIGRSNLSTSVTLRGRITNAVTGSPVRNARIQVTGGPATRTNSDGSFTLDMGGDTRQALPVVIEADGYWKRQTRFSATSVQEIHATLFPNGDGFDLGFFDYVFRDAGEDGTEPWTREPRFEIWTQVFDCVELAHSGVCDELEATSQKAPNQFVNLAQKVIERDSSQYTGENVLGVAITTVEHQPGTRIPSDVQSQIGRITFALVQFPHNTSWARTWSFVMGGDTSRAHVQINKKHKTFRGVYSHELAHTLGYSHPFGSESVPLASIMRSGTNPHENDILHGRLLYGRPPDNRTPDKDPKGFFVNALRALLAGAGVEIETVHQ